MYKIVLYYCFCNNLKCNTKEELGALRDFFFFFFLSCLFQAYLLFPASVCELNGIKMITSLLSKNVFAEWEKRYWCSLEIKYLVVWVGILPELVKVFNKLRLYCVMISCYLPDDVLSVTEWFLHFPVIILNQCSLSVHM